MQNSSIIYNLKDNQYKSLFNYLNRMFKCNYDNESEWHSCYNILLNMKNKFLFHYLNYKDICIVYKRFHFCKYYNYEGRHSNFLYLYQAYKDNDIQSNTANQSMNYNYLLNINSIAHSHYLNYLDKIFA